MMILFFISLATFSYMQYEFNNAETVNCEDENF